MEVSSPPDSSPDPYGHKLAARVAFAFVLLVGGIATSFFAPVISGAGGSCSSDSRSRVCDETGGQLLAYLPSFCGPLIVIVSLVGLLRTGRARWGLLGVALLASLWGFVALLVSKGT
jgi:hypothetical protein